ncbi:MAG: DUF2191 domain-containing protein [Acidobacteriota bacterium]|nr:DUF2191 domain-containing protein [Acidobacteriota bacterium]
MRTTLTLDDDVAEAVDKELRRRSKSSYKEVVNDLIRAGLHARREMKRAPHFKVRSRALGSRRGLNYDDIGGLLEELEGAAHK